MRTVLAVCAALLLTAAGAAQQPVSCRAQAWAIAAQGDFRTAANALALCSAAAAEPAQSAADLLLLARLAQTENALQQRHWWSAAAGMQALAAAAPAALPPALETTLAPALIRFGSGSPAAAATLARV
ncbi:MAG: hypothetical protein ACRD0Y_09555, partial [Terriglobales bacterium]